MRLGTKYLGFPLWGWLVLAAGTAICTAGLGWAVLRKPAQPAEQTVAERRSPAGLELGFEEPDIDSPTEEGGGSSGRGRPAPTAQPAGDRPSGASAASSPPAGRSGPGRGPSRQAPVFHAEFAPPKLAKSLEEIKDAVVKLVIPTPDGEETGAGFLIDGRGWVATNYHVIERANSATKAVLANGMECRLGGVLAKAPEYDLAIVQLEERPFELTILDIGYEGRPKLGTEVFAFGHPYGVDFSLSKGIVSRVVTTGELKSGDPEHLVTQLDSPSATVWIQHTAKISPGNSGGPLLDDKAEVVGINTFVHMAAEYGFASHVCYLRELVEKAERTRPTPLPGVLRAAFPEDPDPESRPGPLVVSAEGMKELFALAATFKLRPKDEEEYELLAGLAKMMAFAKRAQRQPPGDPPLSEQTLKELAGVADELFEKLSRGWFSQADQRAVNRFAAQQMRPGAGTLFFGRVVAVFPQESPPAGQAPSGAGQIQLEDITADNQAAANNQAAGDNQAASGALPEDNTPADAAPETEDDAARPDAAAADDARPQTGAEDAEPERPALRGMFVQLEGLPVTVFVPVEEGAEVKPRSSRWLVVGVVSLTVLVPRNEHSQEHALPVVIAPYLAPCH